MNNLDTKYAFHNLIKVLAASSYHISGHVNQAKAKNNIYLNVSKEILLKKLLKSIIVRISVVKFGHPEENHFTDLG